MPKEKYHKGFYSSKKEEKSRGATIREEAYISYFFRRKVILMQT